MNSYERTNDSGATDLHATGSDTADPPRDDPRPAGSGPTGATGTTDTRTALLWAGRKLFARRGYDGASIRAITREAGANLGSVTYHFGSKEALYGTVLQEVLEPLAARVADVVERDGGSIDRIVTVVRAFFDHLAEHPELPQLMLQEIAAGKAPPPPVESFLRSVSGALAGLVRHGQEAGEVRQGDPVLLGLSCIIQPVHLTLVRHWLGLVKGIDVADPGQRAHLVDHATTFVQAGLAVPEEEPS